MTVWLALLAGGLVGLGVVLAVSGWRHAPPSVTRRPADGFWLLRLGVAALLGAAAALWTGWPVGTVAAGVGGWYLVGLARTGGSSTRRELERMEAVATWAEQLRDTLTAGKGLMETIQATAPVAPLAIRPQVEALSVRISRQRLPDALERFADDVGDPIADLVASVLIMAGTRSAHHVSALLSELAALARERVAMRARVNAKRAATRTELRILMVASIGFMVGLTVFARRYVEPFDTPVGQFVLMIVVVLFGTSLAWLAQLARFREPPRLLVGVES